MDSEGNVKTSTLLVGVGVTIGLLVAGFLVAESLLPRFVYQSYLPALAFLLIFVQVHRSNTKRQRD